MSFDLGEWLIRLPVLLFAITIHEYSHGKAAFSLGDQTAKAAGGLTLNPISHIDPIGAICLFFFSFGWAKPVPVDIRNFSNPRRDTILMALSGPISNLAAAFVTGIFIRHFILPYEIYLKLLFYMLVMNTGLGLFNLVPIPPLGASYNLENTLQGKISIIYRQFGRYAPFLLIGILFFENFTHIRIIGSVFSYPILYLAHLFAGDNLFSLIGLLGS